MQRLWSNIWSDVWAGIGWVVLLMSGIASIFREGFLIFFPSVTSPRALYGGTLRISMILAAILVLTRQRIAIINFENKEREQGANQTEAVRIRSLFASLMHEGQELRAELLQIPHFGKWLEKRRLWIAKVRVSISDEGWLPEAEAFVHSGEAPPEIKGQTNDAYWQRFYGEQLDKYREELKQIVTRKLP